MCQQLYGSRCQNLLILFTFLIALAAHAQINAAEPREIPVWPGDAPGSEKIAEQEKVIDRGEGKGYVDRSISAVHQPTLTLHLPDAPKPTAAVIICPGGGLTRVVIDKEGNDLARWLNERGVAGIVLKFRTVKSPSHFYGVQAPIADLQRAVRLTRARAEKWNVDPKQVGIFGFSAGGLIASHVATHFDAGNPQAKGPVERESCRPDFAGMAYPLISLRTEVSGTRYQQLALGENPTAQQIDAFSSENGVTSETPPIYLAHAEDDSAVPVAGSRLFATACQKAGVPCELYLRPTGGHGYGLRQMGQPINAWPAAFEAWLKARSIIK